MKTRSIMITAAMTSLLMAPTVFAQGNMSSEQGTATGGGAAGTSSGASGKMEKMDPPGGSKMPSKSAKSGVSG